MRPGYINRLQQTVDTLYEEAAGYAKDHPTDYAVGLKSRALLQVVAPAISWFLDEIKATNEDKEKEIKCLEALTDTLALTGYIVVSTESPNSWRDFEAAMIMTVKAVFSKARAEVIGMLIEKGLESLDRPDPPTNT